MSSVASPNPSAKTVLVVEDEPSLANMLVERLQSEGFTVLTATNGKEGLTVAREHHPHIILLDLLMPVMGGTDMLQELRKDAWGAKVPVIVLSNLGDSKHVFDTLKYGVLDFFVKTDIGLDDVIKQVHFRLHSQHSAEH